MKKSKFFRIVALLQGRKVYIAKTHSKRLSAMYHHHRRGEISATACFAESLQSPTIHILHSAEMQLFEAYQYVIAFIHIFKNAGYEILNCPNSIARSEDLHPATKALVDSLSPADPEALLGSTLIRNPTDADIHNDVSVTPPNVETADKKLTIRLTTAEKKRFCEIGANLALNQHDTLLYFFDKYVQANPFLLDCGDDSYIRGLVEAYREEIDKLKAKNEMLSAKLAALREAQKENTHHAQDTISEITTNIRTYLENMESATPVPLEIEYSAYKNYPNVTQYVFPENPGVYIIRPLAVLCGRGRYPARFIIGVDNNGNYLKFRYYPRKHYLGTPIPDSRFAMRGSLWLVKCTQANDGAVDLIGSMPLTVRLRNTSAF